MNRGPGAVAVTGLVVGLAFLYLPTLVVIGYSFNESRLVTVWTGFSFKWYGELFADRRFLGAAATSVTIAVVAATLASMLGVCAGIALGRLGWFRGRALFSVLIVTPVVMPEVITALSLLLLFVALEQAIGWPSGRGMGTVIVAHATFAVSFVALIVQARLAGMARDVEEAAADLGASPATVLFKITLPLLAPAIGAGWLLAFVLSLDDLVIASFTSGPQSTTLPMAIFSSVRLGVSPKVNALAAILVAVSAIGLAGAAWFQRRTSTR
ncbi:MAG: ABC transporter permease subunit [Alphaproteobacteria bacterium]|nr:ABC transporter permease subunit [Alphaproteobacteria bacterium]